MCLKPNSKWNRIELKFKARNSFVKIECFRLRTWSSKMFIMLNTSWAAWDEKEIQFAVLARSPQSTRVGWFSIQCHEKRHSKVLFREDSIRLFLITKPFSACYRLENYFSAYLFSECKKTQKAQLQPVGEQKLTVDKFNLWMSIKRKFGWVSTRNRLTKRFAFTQQMIEGNEKPLKGGKTSLSF